MNIAVGLFVCAVIWSAVDNWITRRAIDHLQARMDIWSVQCGKVLDEVREKGSE